MDTALLLEEHLTLLAGCYLGEIVLLPEVYHDLGVVLEVHSGQTREVLPQD